jgi:hypothetical protein
MRIVRSKQTPPDAIFFYNPLDGGTLRFASIDGLRQSPIYYLTGIDPRDSDRDETAPCIRFDKDGNPYDSFRVLKQATATDQHTGQIFLVSLNSNGQVTVRDARGGRDLRERVSYSVTFARETNKRSGSNKSYHTRKRGTKVDSHKMPKTKRFASY